MSLRSRLLAGLAFVAAVLVAVSIVITFTIRDQLIDQIDTRLSSFSPIDRDGDPRRTVFGQGPDLIDTIPPPIDLSIGATERVSDVYLGFVGADGELTTRFGPNLGDREYGAPAITAVDLPATGSAFFTVGATEGDVSYRVLAQRFGDITTITALPIDDVEETISQLVLVQVLGMLMILAALALVSWWVVHLGIRPIKEMTHTATEIADGDLAVRVPEGAKGTEAGELALSLNRMLGQIEGALDERAASEDRLRRFVADASHELRTPVTTIRGYAELYRHGGLGDPAALDDAMRRTEQEAMRMGRLVEDMLVLARLDEQRPLEVRPVDLRALARDAVADARASWPDREIAVQIGDDPFEVSGDEDRLRQVVANIVGNAVVHTDPAVPVTVRVGADGPAVTLEVEDLGQGMPPEVTVRVTERFFRADPSRSRHQGGSGLGLAIVESAMSAHGGSVAIDSALGRGTIVRLTFPAA